LRGFTKLLKKHLLKISDVYLIGKAEICQDPPTWIQDDQTLLICFCGGVLRWNPHQIIPEYGNKKREKLGQGQKY
jgi:hypothetical protein